VSYTITSKLINVEDWSEQNVESWSQDVAIKNIWRPNAVNPQYLLIVKENEFIVIDKYGNKVLEKSVDYTISYARINNNGEVIVASGAEIHVYSLDGSELFTASFANEVYKVVIGNEYFWVIEKTNPSTIYCYKMSDFSYTSFSYSLQSSGLIDLECSEDGYKAIATITTSAPDVYVKVLSFDGELNSFKIASTRAVTRDTMRIRPDATLGIVACGVTSGGTDYQNIYVVRSDGAYKAIDSRTVPDHTGYQMAIDVNCEKMFFAVGETDTIYKRLIDIDTLEITDAGSFTITENVESSGWISSRFGDMTPDGNYILVHSAGKIFIIEWATQIVKKEIVKSLSGARISMLAVEVT